MINDHVVISPDVADGRSDAAASGDDSQLVTVAVMASTAKGWAHVDLMIPPIIHAGRILGPLLQR
ncbi:hypothetical protein CC117_30975 [Parafrankia colletiae]|uniref:Uncharacterized protein n=1 Tax=Parafrankia colletiae TaxID=573497 RepID=A0A1S1Q6C4_9ACTN|nr:hypothetical protein CC117_30975 [Parafrankia colletiae]